MRLRHEAGRADRNTHAARLVFGVHPPRVQHLIGQLRDAEHVLVRLCRQAEHKVQLHTVPPALERDAAGMEQILLPHILVDRVAQALRTGLGREGQAAFAHFLQAAHDFHRKVVRAQRRQRQADAAPFAVFQQTVADFRQRPVVAAGQGQERRLLIARVFERFDALPDNRLRLARPHRAIDIPCLTEPAAADAAAKQLQIHAVVHDLRGRDDRVSRIIASVQIFDDALRHARWCAVRRRDVRKRAVFVIMRLVQRRHVNARNLRRGDQKALLVPACVARGAKQLQQLAVDFLTLADDHQVEKRRHRLRIAAARAAGKDQRNQLRPVGAAQRNAR